MPNQWDILEYIKNTKRYVCIKELMEEFDMTQPSVNRMVAQLEKFNLVMVQIDFEERKRGKKWEVRFKGED